MPQQRTILVVDDSPQNIQAIAAILKSEHKVKAATSGAKALALANADEGRPDLVLLDVMMPEMDGYEVCERLKGDERTADIPVIFLTARTDTEDEEKGLRLGAVDFIGKPIRPPILLARVATHLNLKRARDELAVARDEAREALARLKETQEQLVDAEKQAALAGMVAGVAHEINTPVGIALTAATTLSDETAALKALVDAGAAKKSHVAAYLDTAAEGARLITGHCRHAAELIRSFKMMAVDRGNDERRRFDLGEYLEDIVRSLSPQMKKTSVKVSVDCPSGLTVDLPPGTLSQIVTNLVNNSVIHGFEDGARPGIITLTACRNESDGTVELRHADDGAGVPPDIAGRIFEPFFTTRRGRGGSGLGLGIVHSLISGRLGGTIRHVDTPGGGATFVIRFPG